MENKWKDTASTIGIIILAPLIALFLTHFVFQSYQVDGPSMETTLHNEDRLIVTKTAKTISKFTGNPYIPERYEIIIFNLKGSTAESQPQEKQLIKRVIGLPGDRVVIKGGVVTIYNKEHPNGYLVDKEGPAKDVIGQTSGNDIDITIKPNEVYVLGDNRDNSLDSRVFGAIKSNDIVGKLSLRIYPFNSYKNF